MSNRKLKIGQHLFRWSGFGAMAFAIYVLAANAVFLFTADSTTGTVVGQAQMEKLRHDIREPDAYAPYIRFTTESGEEVTFLSDIGYGEQFAFTQGEEVSVLYHPGDPQAAKVYSLLELFGLPVILFLFGGILWIVSIIVQFLAETGDDDTNKGSRVNV